MRCVLALLFACVVGAADDVVSFVSLNGTPAPTMGYGYWLPPGFSASSAKYPLIVWIGGTGERGNGTTELPRLMNNGPLPMVTSGNGLFSQPFRDLMAKTPAIVLQPMLPTGATWENSNGVADLHALINVYLNTQFLNRIDYQRVYLTGFSLGGGGAWDYARRYGNEVAAVIPVAGAATAGLDLARFIGLPVWAFHNSDDGLVSPFFSQGWLTQIVSRWGGTSPNPAMPGQGGTWGAIGNDTSGQYSLASGWQWQTSAVTTPTSDYPAITMYATGGHDWAKAMRNTMVGWQWLLNQSLANRPLGSGLVIAAGDSTHTSTTGTWTAPDTTATFAPVLGTQGSSASDATSTTTTTAATFTVAPDVPATGTFKVVVYWAAPGANANSAVPVVITDSTGPHSTTVNQTVAANSADANGFIPANQADLGTYRFIAHGICTIVFSTAGLPAGAVISVTAVRLIPVDVLSVTAVSPSDSSNAGGTVVTLRGTGFDSSPSVTFGGTAATGVTLVNATTITCTAPAHAAGRTDMVVMSGGATYTRSGAFTYTGIDSGTAPMISSALSLQPVRGQTFSSVISANGSAPISFSSSGIFPNGLSLSGATISGTPTTSGSFSITITATNGFGADSRTLSMTVLEPPVITSALSATASVGQSFSYTITANGSAGYTLAASGLPAGLTISGAVISGTPTAVGSTNITLSVTHPTAGTDSKILVLTIVASPGGSSGGAESSGGGSGGGGGGCATGGAVGMFLLLAIGIVGRRPKHGR